MRAPSAVSSPRRCRTRRPAFLLALLLASAVIGHAAAAEAQIPARYRSAERGDSARAERVARAGGTNAGTAADTSVLGFAMPMRSVVNLVDGIGRTLDDPTLYALAIDAVSAVAGPRHPYVGYLRIRLARWRYERGETGAALEAALAGEDILREYTYLGLRTLTERDARRLALLRESAFDLILTIAVRSPAPAERERCWDAFLRSRAVVLDEMASRQRAVVASHDTTLRRLASALTDSRQRLSELAFEDPADDGRGRTLLLQAQARRDSLERELARRSSAFRRDLQRQRAGLADLRRALEPGETVVAYAYYLEPPPPRATTRDRKTPFRSTGSGIDGRGGERKSPFPSSKPEAMAPRASLMAFVLAGPRGEVAALRLGDAPQLDSLVARWRDGVRAGSGNARSIGDSLRRAIWDPVAPLLGAASRVYVVFDGALQLVSFDVLPSTLAPDAYLAESAPVFQYLGCERDLVRRLEAPAPGCGLLAMGGMSYAPPRQSAAADDSRAGPGGCRSPREIDFPPLAASGPEAEEVARAWAGRGAPGRSECAADLVTGTDATETRFKRDCAGRRVLHLATHGFFAGCPPRIEPDDDRSYSRGQDLAPPPAGDVSPMVAAGLVFSAPSPAAGDRLADDGYLTAEEIGGLDLSGVELVVLSACESGVGLVEAREGVLGLRRAFAVAGASRLVVSLWPVKDEHTRRLMRAVYEGRYERGEGLAESLRAAAVQQLRLLRSRSLGTGPEAWGCFVAVGVDASPNTASRDDGNVRR